MLDAMYSAFARGSIEAHQQNGGNTVDVCGGCCKPSKVWQSRIGTTSPETGRSSPCRGSQDFLPRARCVLGWRHRPETVTDHHLLGYRTSGSTSSVLTTEIVVDTLFGTHRRNLITTSPASSNPDPRAVVASTHECRRKSESEHHHLSHLFGIPLAVDDSITPRTTQTPCVPTLLLGFDSKFGNASVSSPTVGPEVDQDSDPSGLKLVNPIIDEKSS